VNTTLKTPKYRRQKRKDRSDVGYVDVDGRWVYLGPWNSNESLARYRRLCAELKRGGGAPADADLTLTKACRAALAAIDAADGKPINFIELELRELMRLVETASPEVALQALGRIASIRPKAMDLIGMAIRSSEHAWSAVRLASPPYHGQSSNEHYPCRETVSAGRLRVVTRRRWHNEHSDA